MIPYKSAKHQSGFSVPSKVLRFFKRKQHFLRLGIRGLVVRLQQESTFENSTRLITDWTIKLVQCKVIPNQDQIWHVRRFSSLEFGHFRMSKQSSFHWIRSGRKAECGQSRLCSTARWHRQGWDPPRAEKTWASAPGSTHILTLARLKDLLSFQQSGEPIFGHFTVDVQMWVQGFLPASCVRQTGDWRQFLQHLSWNVKPQPKITLVQSFGEHYHHNYDKQILAGCLCFVCNCLFELHQTIVFIFHSFHRSLKSIK